MLKNASGIALLIAGLLYTGAGRPAAQASQDSPRDKAKSDRLTLDLYLDMETVSDPQLSPDGAQIIYTRGWVDKVNDKRESALWIMNADGSRNRFLVTRQQRALVADRRSHRLHRAGRTEGHADLRPLDGRRGRDLAGHARRAKRRRNRLVARRHSRSRSRCSSRRRTRGRSRCRRRPEGAKWTEAPRIVERLNYRRDRHGLHRQRLPARVRRAGHRRHAAAADRPATAITPASSGRPTASRSSSAACACETPSTVARVGDLCGRRRQRRHRAADDPQGARRQSDGLARRQARRLHRHTTGRRDTWVDSKLYVMNIDGIEPAPGVWRLGSLAAELQWTADGSGVYFTAQDRGLAEPLLPAAGRHPRGQVSRSPRARTCSRRRASRQGQGRRRR